MGSVLSVNKYNEQTNAVRNHRRLRMEEYQQCCSNNPQNTIQPYDNALLNVTRQYKALSIIGERPQQPQPPEAPPAIPAAAAAATPILAEQTLTTPTTPTAPTAPTAPPTLTTLTTPTTPAAAAPATTRVRIAIQFAMQPFVVLERLPIAGPSRPRHQPESVKSLKICPGRRRILEFSNSDDSSDDSD
ncbi:protein hunchback-like [Leptopilina heterotoma]|uniref:protein hunchback-like n=1 Tax=Leptopilina heterotoma TaxID=63436 RepID=UPI001CA7EA99|nr:protein hunchback-like [Leptopilina heterotoma]